MFARHNRKVAYKTCLPDEDMKCMKKDEGVGVWTVINGRHDIHKLRKREDSVKSKSK